MPFDDVDTHAPHPLFEVKRSSSYPCLVSRGQTAFFRFLFGVAEKRVWCNSVASFVLQNLQILEMLIGVDAFQKFVNKVRVTSRRILSSLSHEQSTHPFMSRGHMSKAQKNVLKLESQ